MLQTLANHPVIVDLAGRLTRKGHHQARGTFGSSTPLLAAALATLAARPVLYLCAHVDEAEEAVDAIDAAGCPVIHLPALQSLPGETTVSIELVSQRVGAVQAIGRYGGGPVVIVAPIHALMQAVPKAEELGELMLEVAVGDTRGPAAIAKWLSEAGYMRTETVEEPGDFAVRGGIIDVFPPGDPGSAAGTDAALGGTPVRMDFFGDTLEKLAEIDLDSMGVDRAVSRARLIGIARAIGDGGEGAASSAEHGVSLDAAAGGRKGKQGGKGDGLSSAQSGGKPAHGQNFLELLPVGSIGILHELLEITEQGRGYFERITGSAEVFGPPAVLGALTRRCLGTLEVTALGNNATKDTIELPVSSVLPIPDEIPDAIALLDKVCHGEHGDEAHDVVVLCQNSAEQGRLIELLAEHMPSRPGTASPKRGQISSELQYIHQGFVLSPPRMDQIPSGVPRESVQQRPLLVLAYHELLHRFQARRSVTTTAKRMKTGRAIDTFLDIQVGDYVVHSEHGIAKFAGLQVIRRQGGSKTADEKIADVHAAARPERSARNAGKRRGAGDAAMTGGEPEDPWWDAEEVLLLEFDGRSMLHVPTSRIDLVQKYVGGTKGAPQLSTLGGNRWKNQKARVAESLKDLASELLRIRAAREHLPGIRYPADTPWQKQFEEAFGFDETEDQLAALAEIKRDMQSARPMDRLLCGDVGYGKTELAIRAAFKAAEAGKQVAVLVPTTVLAEQHERTFASRMADFPFRVESVSRFKTDREVKASLERLATGQVDILIGTHRLLSADVRFKDLGLVIIDEEQRFGVEHKEKLLALRLTVDVLTMTATPIPRTLHLSMLGLRDISSLTTAPIDRRAVVTEVAPHNPKRLAQIIRRELARDGQVYYVHNRVHNIKSVADSVQQLVPEARVVFGHGQMAAGELEDVFLKFTRRQADILVSTTIIESGIDIPTANTMIIADADRFGLAELHQLRGRVGRYKHRAYCYLLLPDDRPLKEKGKKRLAAIEQFSMLGAGFKIAMRDLEIRGAGNILGPEQSGHIAAVGYDMYCQLLERSIKELRHEVVAAPSEVTIELGMTGIIPKPYIPSDQRRLEAYRRIALAASRADLDKVASDLISAYGPLPVSVQRLLDLADLRAGSRAMGVRSMVLKVQPGSAEKQADLVIRTVSAAPVLAALADAPGRAVSPLARNEGEMPEVYFRPHNPASLEPGTLMALLRKRFGTRGDVGDASGQAKGNASVAPMPARTVAGARLFPGIAGGSVDGAGTTPFERPAADAKPFDGRGVPPRGAGAGPTVSKPKLPPPPARSGPNKSGRLPKGLAEIKRERREAEQQLREQQRRERAQQGGGDDLEE